MFIIDILALPEANGFFFKLKSTGFLKGFVNEV